MDNIHIYGLIINFILYIIMIFPIMLFLRQKNFISLKNFFTNFIIITIIEIVFSLFIYIVPQKIFSLFTSTTGIINYATYCSKILFITSTLYGIKYFIPAYIFYNPKYNLNIKKTTIIVLSKIVVNLILGFFGYFLFSTKGFLFSIPLCDLIYFIIYCIIFIKYYIL